MADQANSGIYEIVNLVNGKRYIGSAIHFRKRWSCHLSDLRRGFHHSKALQRAWNKYGEQSFKFAVLKLCTAGCLIEEEQAAFDLLRPEYNTCKVAGSMAGVSPSAATRSKISAALAGRVFSDETKRKISDALLSRGPHPREVYEKISIKNKGRKPSEETRSKLRAARVGRKPALGKRMTDEQRLACSERMRASNPFRGKTHSLEARLKISEARKGKGHPDSEETRAKKSRRMIGNTYWLGRSHTDGTKARLSDMFKGRTFSEETRRKMSESQRMKAPVTAETRAKMSASRSGVKNGSAITREVTIEGAAGLRLTAIPMELRELTGISPAAMSQLMSGVQKSARGWRLVS